MSRVRRALILPVWREHRAGVLGAAVLTFVSYLLVLIAFTMAPVSLVAAGVILSGIVAIALS